MECTTCHETKPLEDFCVRRRNRIHKGRQFVYTHIPKECKSCENKKRTAYAQIPENKEHRNARLKERWQTDPTLKQRQTEFYKTDEGKATIQRYKKSEKFKQTSKEYRSTTLGKEILQRHKKKRKSAEEAGRFTEYHERILLRAYDKFCAYCDVALTFSDPALPTHATFDHVVPLLRGGTHSKWNIVPACWECNKKKGDQTWTPLLPKRVLSF